MIPDNKEIVKKWAPDVSIFPAVQERFELTMSGLIEVFLKDAGDYAQEKFIKCCAQQIRPNEKLLLLTEGIHPSQLGEDFINKETIVSKMQSIESQILSLVSWIHKNTIIYMSTYAAILEQKHADSNNKEVYLPGA